MGGQERCKVRLYANRPHAWAAATVRYAKGLVQIDVADIRAIIGGARPTHWRIEIGAVEINLAAEAVHGLAHCPNTRLEHAVSGRIRDHQRSQLLRVLLRLVAPIHGT